MRNKAIILATFVSTQLLACGSNPNSGNSADTIQSSDAADTADASDSSDGALSTCDGVTCSGAGKCVVEAGAAKCACNPDYEATPALTCIHTKMVPCAVAPPLHATATAGDVEVAYTDGTGWSAPGACPWSCGTGWARVGAACMGASFVEEHCRLSCLELASCGNGSGQSEDACTAACISGASDGAAFAKATCVGLLYEHDTLWCGVLPACDTLATGDTCATRCAAKAKCGFLAAPGITSGASEGECEQLCRAYDTIYGNLKTSDAYAACLDKATVSCNPFELALCEAYNGASVCTNICGWLGSDKYCKYIPGRWSNEAACTKECGSWTPQQSHAVFGCYNKLNFAACDTQKALKCFDPPTELPAGVTALTAAVAGVCPDAMASKSADVNAWHFLGRTELWPAWMQDFGGAVECVKALTVCPSHYDFDWLAPCFKPIAPDVTAACGVALQCLIKGPNKVPYLTVDGTTGMDADRCEVAWQTWKAADSSAFTGVAACLGKVDATDCDAVNACIAGGNPEGAACNDLLTCWDTAGANPYSLPNIDAGLCGGLLAFGQDPKVAQCVNKASNCAAKNACLPIQSLATNAVPACSLLVPCLDAAGVNPFAALGKLTVGTCAAGTSIFNSKNPGMTDMIFGCLQGAADCSARMACLPGP